LTRTATTALAASGRAPRSPLMRWREFVRVLQGQIKGADKYSDWEFNSFFRTVGGAFI
jgi:hypothetical protein